jgi:hypothetical protein
MDQNLIDYLRKRIEQEHEVVTRFPARVTFPCCPKCTNSFSMGTLLDDDCYLEATSMWLRFKKCVNCGWRIEIGTYRRFYKPTKRDRRSEHSQKVQSRHHTRASNPLDGYTWDGTEVDRDTAIPS